MAKASVGVDAKPGPDQDSPKPAADISSAIFVGTGFTVEARR
jgi:hypothetical protein